MDFSVVGSCSVGRNERGKGGRRGEEDGPMLFFFLMRRKGLTRCLVTHLEFTDIGSKTFSLFLHQSSFLSVCLSLGRYMNTRLSVLDISDDLFLYNDSCKFQVEAVKQKTLINFD